MDKQETEEKTVTITNAMVMAPRWWRPWHTIFYIDLPTLISFDVLDRNLVNAWGFKKFVNPDFNYIGVICKIRKRDLGAFFECMIELRKLILMCGHNDYDDFCARFVEMVNPKSMGEYEYD